jgi:hypothetical protein
MSNLPSDTPRLPKWPFFVSDAVLFAIVALIAAYGPRPVQGWPLLAAVASGVLGAVLFLVPFLSDYARKQDEALDERQRALETLSRTVATSAEQISIAANGLHELLELSHRNLKHAEQLPHKLQEKIAEFQQLLTTANDEEKEELEHELATLRSSDSERLEATADKVHKAAADWTKLEAAAAKHLAAANEALAKLAGTAETGAGNLTHAAETAAVKASAEIAKALTAAQTGGASVINDKLAAALAEIDTQLAQGAGRLTVRATDAAGLFDAKLAALEAAIAKLETAVTKAVTGAITPTAQSSILEQSSSDPGGTPMPRLPAVAGGPGVPPVVPAEPATASEPATATPVEALLPKRPRKPRREEPVAQVAAAEVVASDASKPDTAAEATPIAPPVTEAVPSPEPTAVPAPLASAAATPPPVSEIPPSAIANPPAEEPKPARKRAAKKTTEPEPPSPEIAAEEPAAPPASSEFSQEPPEEARATSAVSADGATRLLVTAYVGIGNRLFLRGVGPGLSQDKGVPLQFVSIGKWRWETADATAPIRVKLYKNDQAECSALGEIVLEPGHQAEVTANF